MQQDIKMCLMVDGSSHTILFLCMLEKSHNKIKYICTQTHVHQMGEITLTVFFFLTLTVFNTRHMCMPCAERF